jgi:hypothetical protein
MSTSEPLCEHENLPGTCSVCDADFLESMSAALPGVGQGGDQGDSNTSGEVNSNA